MRKISEEQKKTLLTRSKTGAFLTAFCVLLIIVGVFSDSRSSDNGGFISQLNEKLYPLLPILMSVALVLILTWIPFAVARELDNCFTKFGSRRINFWIGLTMLLAALIPTIYMLVSIYLPYYNSDVNILWWNSIIFAFVQYAVPGLLLIPAYFILKKSNNFNKVNLFGYSFIIVLLPILLINVFYLFFVRSFATVMVIVFLVSMTDTWAYISGTIFGKHKLAPIISPKKTWEGAIGGFLVAISLALLLMFTFSIGESQFKLQTEFFGAQYQSAGSAKWGPGETIGWWMFTLAMFAVLSVYSMFSDLLFSVFKRKNKIKDYSNIFPGHGGLLDRIDSLAPTLVLYSAIMFIVGVCSTFINHTDTILTPAAAAISGA